MVSTLLKYILFFSVLDIVSDFILFFEYIEGSKEFPDYLVEDQTSGFFGNATTVTCSPMNSTSDGQDQFVCVRYNIHHYKTIINIEGIKPVDTESVNIWQQGRGHPGSSPATWSATLHHSSLNVSNRNTMAFRHNISSNYRSSRY